MKNFYFLLVAMFCINHANAQYVFFPDSNLKNKLLALNVDLNGNNEIDFFEAENLSVLNLRDSNIHLTEGLQYFTGLSILDIGHNPITSFPELSQMQQLTNLTIATTNLSSLTVQNLPNLQWITCTNTPSLLTLTIQNLPNLTTLWCGGNSLTSVSLNNLPAIQDISISQNRLTTLSINSLTSLESVNCQANQLTDLYVSSLVNLRYFRCAGNQIPNLNVAPLTNLEVLNCASNLLTSLNVSTLHNLISLSCGYNQLPTLNLNGLTTITDLRCSDNLLTDLNVSQLRLRYLECDNNQLTTLDVTEQVNLNGINCSDNLLQTLDLTHSPILGTVDCAGNQLRTLFLKNGSNEDIYMLNNPNLQYICADESQINSIQTQLNELSYANCHVNSFCSFTPGGTYYDIQGAVIEDADNNGCDPVDSPFSNFKFGITNGTETGNLITNATGHYKIPVSEGSYILTPEFENPSYFNTTPPSLSVTFPNPANPVLQDFCVTANGTHHDLEVVLIPMYNLRPGVPVSYKLIYKNKGTTTQSGQVGLVFNDNVLDFFSAFPAVSGQATHTLSWNFTNLKPLEVKEISIIFQVNTPTENPAVNAGDILHYEAVISSAAIDEMPEDNLFSFDDTAVNSLDPNDKTCLEGATIAPEMAGKYVHYKIRFENTGTANAENVVVKDMIDTAKFDLSSLVPLHGSHAFVTKIVNGGKVEFIFENIDLPFDDANNDGYVVFKIKTKPDLVVGDSFSNTANIYFDYNFPIATNTATTTIAILKADDFGFSDDFTLYPNPAGNVLNIRSKKQANISDVSVYNILGQLILASANFSQSETLDVSSLKPGSYVICVNSDKGTSTAKFLKK